MLTDWLSQAQSSSTNIFFLHLCVSVGFYLPAASALVCRERSPRLRCFCAFPSRQFIDVNEISIPAAAATNASRLR